MKKSLLTFILFFGVLTVSSKNRIVEMPLITISNQTSLDFQRVELSDTATTLHAKAVYRPGGWIRIAKDSYLKTADGKQYKLKYGNGIVPGAEHYMPESGVSEFDLIFEPIPEKTDEIIFSEGNGGWTLGMNLDGKLNVYPAGLPEALKTSNSNAQIPEVSFDIDSATVNFHILNYNPVMGNKLNYAIKQISGQITDAPAIDIDANGNGRLKLLCHGTSGISAYNIGGFSLIGRATVNPGETIDIYMDPLISGNVVMRHLRNEPAANNKNWSWHNGTFSDFDSNKLDSKNILQLSSGKFGDYRMGADEYIDYVIAEYEKAERNIRKNENLSPLSKEKTLIDIKANAIDAVGRYKYLLNRSYWAAHGNWGQQIPADSITCELTPEHFAKVSEFIEPNDPRLILASSSPIFSLPFKEWEKSGVDAQFLNETGKYTEVVNTIKAGKGSEEDITPLESYSNPFYAKSAKIFLNDVRKSMANIDMSLCQPTPDVATDSIFDAIIAPHKGKVVMVDLWNTWCGPCRAALQLHEPEKSGELSSEDIVWIYIADESSPLKKYFEIIPDIKGVHYRLNEEQIGVIRKRFEVDGIPYYILVDRKGNATGRPDLRDPELYKKTILEELAAPAE
ncbi:MAG: TlpA family protein disulfide reductase [Paramuribaculum sp.]|nr:TlpA family protein disulfide reductase [Paramuribaculum sp.]